MANFTAGVNFSFPDLHNKDFFFDCCIGFTSGIRQLVSPKIMSCFGNFFIQQAKALGTQFWR